MAQTANASLTDIQGMAESMKFIAPAAQALGLSVEDVLVAIGVLAHNGTKGSEAGTSLPASLLPLANPTGQTVKTMKKLGISINDSKGHMKDLPTHIGDNAAKMKEMTNSQKVATAAQ